MIDFEFYELCLLIWCMWISACLCVFVCVRGFIWLTPQITMENWIEEEEEEVVEESQNTCNDNAWVCVRKCVYDITVTA